MVYWKPFRVRAPGRVCLFGEHSDYLGLDVIPAAIDLSIELVGTPIADREITVNYTDLNESDSFMIGKPLEYRHKRDYLRSVFNLLLREGAFPEIGWDIRVCGDIPIAAGLSSSSALTVASVFAVCHMANIKKSMEDLVDLAFRAEVAEFGESGGKMDHNASVYGGIIHVEMDAENRVTRLPAELDGFVIGDSCEKKDDTVGDLKRIREIIEAEYSDIRKKIPKFNNRHTAVNRVVSLSRSRPERNRQMAEASLRNRDLTAKAYELLKSKSPKSGDVGLLLNKQHEILRDDLDRSTPKIEKLIQAALDAGALGCKINGSGGGGSMVAYAPGREEEVAAAIESAQGQPYIVEISQGASLTILRE